MKYLSYGGGVDSTALLILGGYDEALFVNHGGDYPETYAYVEKLRAHYPITVLIPDVDGCTTIEEYCKKYRIMPLKFRRWCTDKFKIRVMYKYMKRPCESWLGISYDERHRIKESRVKDVELRFPLVEQRITRDQAKEIIQEAGFPVPKKSGCWFCPFITDRQKRKGLAVANTQSLELFAKEA